jgi:ABC-type Na+ transport system ATPase subunit NatA
VTEIAESLCDRVAIIHDGKILKLDAPPGLCMTLGVKTLEDAFVKLVEKRS